MWWGSWIYSQWVCFSQIHTFTTHFPTLSLALTFKLIRLVKCITVFVFLVYTSAAHMKCFERQMLHQRSQWPLQIGSYYKNTSKLEGVQAGDQEFCYSFERLERSFENITTALKPMFMADKWPSVVHPCGFLKFCGLVSHPGVKAYALQLLVSAIG